jgi:hypothetical protein
MTDSDRPRRARFLHRRLGRRTLIGAGAALLLMAGGVAYATIPDVGTSLVHGCYNTTSGALRVVDPGKGQTCAAGEASLNWGSKGLHWRGTWTPTAAFGPNDVTTLNGTAFIAKAANTNSRPPSSNWAVLADKPYANVFSESNAANPGTFPVLISANLTQVAQTSALPAGNFTVTAQAVVFMDNGAQSVVCDLVDNHGNFATSTAETSGPPDSSATGVVQTLSQSDAFFNEPANSRIFLKCAKGDGADPNTSEVSSAALVVNQVGTLVYNGTTIPSP